MSSDFFNIRGLQSHIDELRSFVMGNGVHIMAINETKLLKTIPDCLVSIKDFSLGRKRQKCIWRWGRTVCAEYN